jgi:hypothetical protein
MAIVTLSHEEVGEIEKFNITCNCCGSLNTQIEIDWSGRSDGSWNEIKIICKNCETDETCYKSD